MIAKTTDAAGNVVRTRMRFYVIGGDYAWAYNDGSRINLQADQESYAPGEVATIAVKTPITGTALVTVERNRVHRHFVREISPQDPLIEIPLEEGDAPDAYVSVVLIRGARESEQKFREPDYKIGFCQLNVERKARPRSCRGPVVGTPPAR